jgi:antibiotic biosynthesis monooxygenase (ABM) superfamily enzyme
MIVFNTTFHAHTACEQLFLDWLRAVYIPQALADGRLSEARLTRVLNAEESDGVNYSLQFRADNLDALHGWYAEVGDELVVAMARKFGQQVAGFSTLLEEVEL